MMFFETEINFAPFVLQSERVVCTVLTFCGQGVLQIRDVDILTFWFKSIGFFEIYGVSVNRMDKQTRGVEPVFGHFLYIA